MLSVEWVSRRYATIKHDAHGQSANITSHTSHTQGALLGGRERTVSTELESLGGEASPHLRIHNHGGFLVHCNLLDFSPRSGDHADLKHGSI